MSEMKIGDKVRFVKGGIFGQEYGCWWKDDKMVIGEIYTIIAKDGNGLDAGVIFHGCDYYYHPSHFEIVK